MLSRFKLKQLALCLPLLMFMPVMAQTTAVDAYYPKVAIDQKKLKLTGSIEAKQDAELASLQAGVIQQLFVEAGDQVQKGQKLMSLDATLAELRLAETRANLDASVVAKTEAQRLYNEVLALSKKQVVAQTLIDERKAAVATAKAELSRQQNNLNYQQEVVNRHTLYAPFAGTIAKRNVDLGEWVSQQSSVYTLVQHSALRLVIAIPQEYYQQLQQQPELPVTIAPDYIQARSFNAKISRLIPVSNNQSRTLIAHIDLPATENLLPGMSANAELAFSQQQNQVLWLPKSAIKQHPDGGQSIFAIVDNKAKRYIVNVVESKGEQIAVSGAPVSYAYVTSGVELLRDGTSLQVNNTQGQNL